MHRYLLFAVMLLLLVPTLTLAQEDDSRRLAWEDYEFAMDYPAAWGDAFRAAEDTYGISPNPSAIREQETFFVTLVAFVTAQMIASLG